MRFFYLVLAAGLAGKAEALKPDTIAVDKHKAGKSKHHETGKGKHHANGKSKHLEIGRGKVKKHQGSKHSDQWPWSRRHHTEESTTTAMEARAAVPEQAAAPAQEEAAATTKQPETITELSASTIHAGLPTKPGCYMKMPSGCPKEPMKTQAWRHDTWAEQKGLSEEACKRRKATWNKHCETEDAKMLYIAGEKPVSALQVEPVSLSGENWPFWPFGKKKGTTTAAPQASQDDDAQEEARIIAGKEAVVVPTQPGCYMRMPSGCPKQPMRTQVWRKDAWAEQHQVDEAGCNLRKITWDKFCETEDANMLYIPVGHPTSMSALQMDSGWPWSRKSKKAQEATEETQPLHLAAEAQADPSALEEYPSQPGCYMKMPSGCPKKPMRTQAWRHDTWAEQQGLDEEKCKQRKSTWDKYCESTNARTVFVAKQ